MKTLLSLQWCLAKQRVCVYAHMYTCMYMCVYMCVWVCVNMCACARVHVWVRVFVYVYVRVYAYVCMYVCMSMCDMNVCMCIHMFMCLSNFHSLVFPSPSQFYSLFIWQQKSKLCVWLLREILGQWMFFSYCLWGCHHVTIESMLCFLICWCFSHVETIRGELISLTFLRKDLILQLLKQDTFPNSQSLPNNSKYL